MKKLEPAPKIDFYIPRDYVKMLKNDTVQALINKIHEEYYYWDKVNICKCQNRPE